MLHDRGRFDLESRIRRTKDYLDKLMQPTEKEREYIDRFRKKEYCPELLFDNEDIIDRVKNHPMALWKCKTSMLR